LVAVERPAEYQEVLEVLRQAGWRAAAVAPKAQLAAVWGGFDQDLALPTRPAPEAGRGAGVAR